MGGATHHPTLGTVCINMLPWEVQMPGCGESGPFLVRGGSCVFTSEFGCVVVIEGAVIETRTFACRRDISSPAAARYGRLFLVKILGAVGWPDKSHGTPRCTRCGSRDRSCS